jgi:hypothetical protein
MGPRSSGSNTYCEVTGASGEYTHLPQLLWLFMYAWRLLNIKPPISCKDTTRAHYESRADLNLFPLPIVDVFVRTAVDLPVALKIASPPVC